MTGPPPDIDEILACLNHGGLDAKRLEELTQALCRHQQPTPIVEKLRAVVTDIVQDKGSMVLFALCRGGEGLPTWDVVVSAQWVREDARGALDYVGKRVSRALSADEMTSLARIVPLPPEAPFVTAITAHIRARPGSAAYFAGCVFNDVSLEEMWLLCSQRPDAPKDRDPAENEQVEASS